MTPAAIRVDVHSECGSGHLTLSGGGVCHRVERITATELTVASPYAYPVGQAWGEREVRIRSVGGTFLWFADVIGQPRSPLVLEAHGPSAQAGRRDIELRWLEQHTAELQGLAGHWVAINGSELISHGRDLKEVLEEARKRKADRPLLFHVPGSEMDISFAVSD